MSTMEKVKWIYEECRVDLDPWCREFISDIYDNAQDEDELTHRQIEKINEIWEDLGL